MSELLPSISSTLDLGIKPAETNEDTTGRFDKLETLFGWFVLAGFPAGPFWGGDSPPPPKKKKSVTPPQKFVLTLFVFTLSPLPLGYSPPKSFNSPPKGEILQETLLSIVYFLLICPFYPEQKNDIL